MSDQTKSSPAKDSAAGGLYIQVQKVIANNLFLAIFLTVGIWTIPNLTYTPYFGLDPSWGIGINLAQIHNFQFGSEILFTYGLLGFLVSPLVLDYGLWKLGVFFCVLVHFLLIFSVFLLLKENSARWFHYVLFIPLLLVILPVKTPQWALLTASAVFLYLILIRQEKSRVENYGVLATGFLLGVVSLTKFDMLWNTLYLILAFCGITFLMKRDVKPGVTLVCSFFFSFTAFWLIMRQDPGNILPYITGGFELTRGYGDAMAAPGAAWQSIVAGLSIMSVLIIAIWFFLRKKRSGTVFLILTGFILFTAFKLGFVRHDDGHILAFFWIFLLFLGILLVFLTIEPDTTGAAQGIFLLICQALIVMGILAASILVISPWTVQKVITPEASPASLSSHLIREEPVFFYLVASQKAAVRNEYQINDQVLGRIGNRSVDILPWDIALCWAYDLNWSPRPVFQSYSVYTSSLDTRNSLYFTDPLRSPEKILYSYGSIDDRYPLFDEPATFRTILNNYTYEDKSGVFVLLSRREVPTDTVETDLGSVTVRLGEPAQVPEFQGKIFGYIDVQSSLAGTVMKNIYKTDPAYIRFQLKDGTVSRRYRFITGNAGNGIFLSRQINNSDTLADLFRDNLFNDIDRITIDTDHPEYYEESVRIRFTGIPSP